MSKKRRLVIVGLTEEEIRQGLEDSIRDGFIEKLPNDTYQLTPKGEERVDQLRTKAKARSLARFRRPKRNPGLN